MQNQRDNRKRILDKFSLLNHDEQKQIKENFSQSLRQSLYAKLYKTDGFSNVLVEDQWIKFLMFNWEREHDNILPHEI